LIDIERRIVRCPACGGGSVYAQTNPYRPFCCERCRTFDLGAWSAEGYRVDGADPREAPPADKARR
jgi:endogenous inhibitor of DNA gyrase (YacG/DUF329 family)